MSLEGPNTRPNPTIEAIRSIKGFDGLPADTRYELSNENDSIHQYWPNDLLQDPDLSKRLISFFIDLSSHEPYQKESGEYRTRNLEKNRITSSPETSANHFLYVSEINSNIYENLPEKNEIKKAISGLSLNQKDTKTLIILASFCHDWVEDRTRRGIKSEKVIDELNQMLLRHGFDHLRIYLKPLVRTLTHYDKLNSKEYIDRIENPPQEYFQSKELKECDKKGLKAMAKLIKTGDINHNHLSPQSANALFKDDVYWPAVHRWLPELEDIVDPRFWKNALTRNPHAKLWWEYLKGGGNPEETSTYELMYERIRDVKKNKEDLNKADHKIIRLFLSWDTTYIRNRIREALQDPNRCSKSLEKIFSVSIKEGSRFFYDEKESRISIENKSIENILTEFRERILALNEFEWIIGSRKKLA